MDTKLQTLQGKLTWGILGTGYIAKVFATALAMSKTGELVAVGSRSQKNAEQFAAKFKLPRHHGSYEALLADPMIQAVYVATPHPLHAVWTIKACEAGKHVLCEKPLAMNQGQALSMFAAAQRAGVFLMEAFMYRSHPQTATLVELLRNRTIGEVHMVEARYGMGLGFNAESRIFRKDLGGGAILDVGCYPVSIVRLVAGAALGNDFAEPSEVKGIAYLGKSVVDEYTAAVMKFPGGIVAELAAAITVKRELIMRIYGSKGRIIVPNPYAGPYVPEIGVWLDSQKKPRIIRIRSKAPSFDLEADAFAAGVTSGRAPFPALSREDSLGNMKALDLWRESIGLTYELEA